MKGFLFFIILILAGALVWTHYRSGGGNSRNEEIHALEDELFEANSARDRLEKELEDFKDRLRKYETIEEVANSPVVSSSPTGLNVNIQKRVEVKGTLEKFQAIYDQTHRSLREELAKAETSLSRAKEALQLKQEQAPVFQEQTTATDAFGNFLGNRGTRTSNADRDKVMEKFNDEVSKLRNDVTNAEKKILEIRNRMTLLDQQYRTAIDKARTKLP